MALIQANYVKDQLSRLVPTTNISIVHISTKGDRDKTDFLYKSESVGFFTSEVENALLSRQANIAVHSLKDLPTMLTPGLFIAAIPKREQTADVLIAGNSVSSISTLSPNASVGTSSLRRISQLKRMRPDLNCQHLRGNVENRIRRVEQGFLDAIIIAQAGVNRLGMAHKISAVLPPEEFIPAPGQGALAVQTREDDAEICGLAAQIDDVNARITAEAERHILACLHGGCSIPLGVYARIEGGTIYIHAVLCSMSADKQVKKRVFGPVDKSKRLAEMIAHEMLKEGGREILDEIRHLNP